MRRAFRASIYHYLANPNETANRAATEFFADGLLIVDGGKIVHVDDATELLADAGDMAVEEFPGKLIVPDLIDCHVHFPQIDVIAAYGEQLLDWLNRYAYPGELRYADADYAAIAADFFLDELVRNGTTSAAVFTTVHAHTADAIFRAADARDMRMIAGKVLMDRNCPAELSDTPKSAYADSKRLIEAWHDKGRLGYAITPRFAVTSSKKQLEEAGRLASEYPDTWVHTHLAENQEEIDEIAEQFP